MAKINLLDSQIFNRIAAGEVVENPRSVIKELVENCIDAGATSITVDITGGGIECIKVSDNGSGMAKEDLERSILPHATSKISTINDLNNISTLGFRGEALPSIASVSMLKITSREKGSELGNYIEYDFGTLVSSGDCGAPEGTTVVVSGLFEKIPARKKFLRKPSSETSDVTALILRFILSNYNVSIKYISDGKIIYHSDGKGLQSALYAVYGREFFENLVFVESIASDIALYGFVGKPGFSKHNRSFQTLVVNGRYVTNTDITFLMQSCYKDFLMTKQFPVWVIFIDVPDDMVDVNVHPNKMDIKFADFQTVKKRLHSTVLDVVKSLSGIPSQLFSSFNDKLAPKQYRNSIGQTSYDDAKDAVPAASQTSIFDSNIKINFDPESLGDANSQDGGTIGGQNAAKEFVFSEQDCLLDDDNPQATSYYGIQNSQHNVVHPHNRSSQVSALLNGEANRFIEAGNVLRNGVIKESTIFSQIFNNRISANDASDGTGGTYNHNLINDFNSPNHGLAGGSLEQNPPNEVGSFNNLGSGDEFGQGGVGGEFRQEISIQGDTFNHGMGGRGAFNQDGVGGEFGQGGVGGEFRQEISIQGDTFNHGMGGPDAFNQGGVGGEFGQGEASEGAAAYYNDPLLGTVNDGQSHDMNPWQNQHSDFSSMHEIKIQCKIFNTYILVEYGRDVYIIDQHAAHERIIFDEIMTAHMAGSLAVQPLLLPYIFDLHHAERQILDDNLEVLERLGFTIAALSGNSYSLSSVPYSCVNINCSEFIKYFFDNLGKNPLKHSDLVREKVAKAACKAAVKGKDDLAIEEIKTLLARLSTTAELFCPHGRPIIIKISKSEIEKWFKRIV